MDNEILVTLEGSGLSYKQTTNLQKAGQIISFLSLDTATKSPQYEVATNSPSLLAPKATAPREVIANSGAKTYAQKIAALAFFLREQMGKESFSSQDIRAMFKKMGDEPRNFTRDFNNAVDAQYIVLVDEDGQYQLTTRGEDAVNEGFSSEPAIKKSSGSKRSHVSHGTRDEIKNMPMNTDMPGYPNYHDLPTKGDKILWLLTYADKNGVTELSPTEVDSMSVALRERIESKGFTALNDRNIKKAFVIKTSAGFQIQKKGTDYLSSLNKTIAATPEA